MSGLIISLLLRQHRCVVRRLLQQRSRTWQHGALRQLVALQLRRLATTGDTGGLRSPQTTQTLSDMERQPLLGGQETAPDPSDSEMQRRIERVLRQQRHPGWFYKFTSQMVITIVGLISKIILTVLNRMQVLNRERLVNLVSNRPKGVPLITVSNHASCFDDPGLWAALPVRYLCNTRTIRWSMAAHDICFTSDRHARLFMYGKCIPVVRGGGVYQEAVDLCIQKCSLGDWVHVFPEGKVNMTKEFMRLKWGVGRIIYESPITPIVLPMWHEGMDDMLPNVEPYVPQRGKHITFNIGQPLDLGGFIQELKDRQVPEPEARKLITDKIQDAFWQLRLETVELHRKCAAS